MLPKNIYLKKLNHPRRLTQGPAPVASPSPSLQYAWFILAGRHCTTLVFKASVTHGNWLTTNSSLVMISLINCSVSLPYCCLKIKTAWPFHKEAKYQVKIINIKGIFHTEMSFKGLLRQREPQKSLMMTAVSQDFSLIHSSIHYSLFVLLMTICSSVLYLHIGPEFII